MRMIVLCMVLCIVIVICIVLQYKNYHILCYAYYAYYDIIVQMPTIIITMEFELMDDYTICDNTMMIVSDSDGCMVDGRLMVVYDDLVPSTQYQNYHSTRSTTSLQYHSIQLLLSSIPIMHSTYQLVIVSYYHSTALVLVLQYSKYYHSGTALVVYMIYNSIIVVIVDR